MSYKEISELIPHLNNIAEINYLMQQLNERRATLKKRKELEDKLQLKPK